MHGSNHISEVCRRGDFDAVVATLQLNEHSENGGVNAVDDEGRTVLHWALAVKSFDIAKRLLAEPFNARCNIPDAEGTTALMVACSVQAPEEIVAQMVGHMSVDELNVADRLGNTALHSASSRGSVALVKLLLRSGCEILPNKRGQTPLHRAVSRGATECVDVLLSAGKNASNKWSSVDALVNAQDSHGDTALHYASMENNQEIGEMLLLHGAEREIRNKDGKAFWEI